MIREVVELNTLHLRDSTASVNALRSEVPLDPLDGVIDEVTVVSEFDVPYIAGGRIPPSLYKDGPVALVRRADDVGEFSPPGNPEIISLHDRVGIAIALLFPRRDDQPVHKEQRLHSALLRVICRSLHVLVENVPYEEKCLRDVQLSGIHTEIRVSHTIAALSETDLVVGSVHVDWRVVDRWAQKITP